MAQDDGSYFFDLKKRQDDADTVAALKFLQEPATQVEDSARDLQQSQRMTDLQYVAYGDPKDQTGGAVYRPAAQYKAAKISEAWRVLGDADSSTGQQQTANAVLKQAGLDAVSDPELIGRRIVPGSPEDLSRYTTMNTGLSYRMLQDIGMQYPGVEPEKKAFAQYESAGQKQQDVGVFQGEAPARAIGRAAPVTTTDGTNAAPTGTKSNIGLTNTIGSEFGEVDNPQGGGYTEPNWDVGAWGDKISGKETNLVALPPDKLRAYGYGKGDSSFAKKFNAQYDIQVVNPTNGQVTITSLGDIGPGKSTGAGLDMTWGTREAIGLDQNFKGPIQYRIVPKGSALPDNTVISNAAVKGGAAVGNAAAAAPAHTFYIQPLNPKDLKDPEIYGAQMTSEDKARWARHLADDYAGQMDDAGSPLTVAQYKDIYKSMYDGTDKKSVGEKPKDMSPEVNTQFAGLNNMIPQIDALNEAHKVALNKLGAGMNPLGIGVSQEKNDFVGQRDALVGPVSKSLFANVGSLSDTDVKRAQGALPGEWDDEVEAQKKTDRAKANVLAQMRTIIEMQRNAHVDTSGIEQMYQKAKAGYQKDQQDRSKKTSVGKIQAASQPAGQSSMEPRTAESVGQPPRDTWGQQF